MKKLVSLVLTAILSLSLVACSSNSNTGSDAAALYTAGTYTGVAAGRNGDVTVEVTVSASKIESVTVTAHEETEGIADPAIEEVPAAIVEKQSTEVDTVSGATMTSEAIINAAKAALDEAAVK